MSPVLRPAALALLALLAAPAAHASPTALALNGTGTGFGFSLATTIGGMPYVNNNSYTIVGVTTNALGQILAPDTNGGTTSVYANSDGQLLSGYLSSIGGTLSGLALARVGGTVYASQSGGGYYVFDNSGSTIGTLALGVISRYGMWANPVNGHLLSSSYVGLIDIDPIAVSYTVVDPLTGFYADGVTVTPDGQIAYIADYPNDVIRGYSLFTGTNALYGAITYGQNVFNTGFNNHGGDGMGVLAGTCALAGQIVVNNNDGTVGLVNPTSGVQTTIASGGNRGDYAALDQTNGTLFLSQNDAMMRLTGPAGCSIGTVITPGGDGGVTPTPEPSSLALLATGLAGLLTRRRTSTRPSPT